MDYTANLKTLTIHRLKCGDLELTLAPELGGAILYGRFKDIDFMRPWTGALTPRRTSGYPLVPFSNRIANGQFLFAGEHHQLAQNFGDHPHTLHGVGWQQNWDGQRLSDTEAIMKLQHRPSVRDHDQWPYAFDVTQHFIVREASVEVSMTIINKDHRAMPAGLGWHPFFPRHNGVRLRFNAQHIYQNSATMLPEQPAGAIPSEWDFTKAHILDYPGLDNCYHGWDGCAELIWPEQKLALTLTASESLGHLVVMTPPYPNNFFAVEPVSHANNALNATDPESQGIIILASGATTRAFMKLSLKEL